jgi:type IX secretion system PorP/SprF family membrane protein
MGMKYFKILPTIFLAFIFSSVKGQDPEFSQFYTTKMYLNPAYVGENMGPTTVMSYRNQWSAFGADYSTAIATYENHSKALKGGYGIMFLNDQSRGVMSLNSVGLGYSNYQKISRKFVMRAGFQLNYTQENINFDGLTFPDMINPYYGFIYATQEPFMNDIVRYVDVSTGVVGYGKNYSLGMAIHHINEPNESFLFGRSRLPMKYTVHGAYSFPFTENVYGVQSTLTPNIMYRRQGEFQQLNFGVSLDQKVMSYNVWYRGWLGERYRDALVLGVGVKNDKLSVRYSYDITVSELTVSTGGSHELSLVIDY